MHFSKGLLLGFKYLHWIHLKEWCQSLFLNINIHKTLQMTAGNVEMWFAKFQAPVLQSIEGWVWSQETITNNLITGTVSI